MLLGLLCALLFIGAAMNGSQEQGGPPSIGLFEDHSDVGTVLHPGSVEYDRSTHNYTISGSGENMWFAADDFQYAWKKVSGDVSLTADVSLLGTGGDPHRKAVLMIRQSLDPDAAYADVARHGDGLTSLQFRDEKGTTTHEIESNVSGPKRLRIEKHGDYFYMYVAGSSEDLHFAGGSARVVLKAPFYVGIGVCAHNKAAVQQVSFGNVELQLGDPTRKQTAASFSTLETITVASTDARVSYVFSDRVESPNWTHDGESLLFNRNGNIERVRVDGGPSEVLDAGSADQCNSHHGISPDGRILAISCGSSESKQSDIYVVPIAGGAARRITQHPPSYWQSWSPDGKLFAFTHEEDGNSQIYTMPSQGGSGTRLSTGKGAEDGAEFAPDGKYIYFSSNRNARMQVWRMRPDGSGQEQVTSDQFNNAFPHVSPDGQRIVFLSYEGASQPYPTNRDVLLRVMSLADKQVKVLAKLVGGQGTIDAPSWSPDSRRLAFVSYQVIQ